MADFSGPEIILDRGDTDYLDFAFTRIDGTPQDITGWTISFTMKRGLLDTDAEAVLHKTTGNGGITITSAVGGTGAVLKLATDFTSLPNRRQRFYGDLVGKDGMGGVNRAWKGFVVLNPSVTLEP